MTCLIYIAGNVGGYKVVNYVIDKGSNQIKVPTFFSAHALYKAFNPDKVVVLLPDSLIKDTSGNPDDVKKAYRDLISTHARGLNLDQQTVSEINSFLEKLEIFLVPNVGIGKAIKSVNGKVVDTRPSENYTKDRNPVFIFNVVYSVLQKLHCDHYMIDLTHGTNVLIAAVLTAGSLFDSTFYAAPIIGSPDQGATVKVVDLTDLINAMKDALMISSSIEMLDERYFRDYSSELHSLNPNNFKDKNLISRIKSSDPGMIIDLLWNIRNGFTVNAVKGMIDVSNKVQVLENDVNNLTSYFIDWVNNQDLDVKDIILSHFYSTLKVKDILMNGDDLTVLRYLLDLYVNAKLYDKALSLARELPVAFCLKHHGGGTFGDNEKHKNCDELVKEYYKLEHGTIIQYRNMLMHGGLSVDLKVTVNGNGSLNSNKVNKNDIEKLVKELGEYVDEAISKVKNS
ncbi:TM1812 family CRISPR-associated protein [Acidianus sp. HS-5]|uniref:TM1812 family CRISPR-associated protein n=1 Tax=Acidianus sp. HS-5 TaxID=2886040 RepID=UPI001F26508A|nr:TM1812 family CRISPR-associated protein [Acidianus sp. HS-5]BDC17529.1 hypothetical protein HS5_04190 [Acidianus sp. HS-5]